MSVIGMHLDFCARISKGKRKATDFAGSHLGGEVHPFA